jgi:hypothetical protein
MNRLNIFKTSILFFTLIILFAACKSKSTTETRDIQLLTDTSAYMNHPYADTAVTVNPELVPATKGSVKHSAPHNSGSSTTSTTTTTTKNNNTGNTSSSTTGNQQKGMSKAAKGAIIGGAAGAVGGAVITKKVGGAAVGAAVGAASGYIIGRDQDKQDGRVKKRKQ